MRAQGDVAGKQYKIFSLFVNFNSRYTPVQSFILLINMASRNWIHKCLLHVSSLQSTF